MTPSHCGVLAEVRPALADDLRATVAATSACSSVGSLRSASRRSGEAHVLVTLGAALAV